MKINKTLAAGIAATLAVTSLASVASAVKQRTWDMEKTYGKVTYVPTAIETGKIYDLGRDYLFQKPAEGQQPATFGIAIDADEDGEPDVDDNDQMIVDTTDHMNGMDSPDYFMPFKVNWDFDKLGDAIKGVSLVITGKQLASDGATTEKLVQKATLEKFTDGYWMLPIYVESAPRINNNYAFMPERFVQVDSISVDIAIDDGDAVKVVEDYLTEAEYKAIVDRITNKDNSGKWHASYSALTKTVGWGIWPLDLTIPVRWEPACWGGLAAYAQINPTGQIFDIADYYVVTDSNYDGIKEWPVKVENGALVPITNKSVKVSAEFAKYLDDSSAQDADESSDPVETDKVIRHEGNETNIVKNADGTATLTLAEAAFEVDLTLADKGAKGQMLLKKLMELCKNNAAAFTIVYTNSTYETFDEPAWMPRTANNDETIVRNEVWKLSDTEDYNSDSDLIAETDSQNQTYNVEDYNKGTKPFGFSGMASQFADFFNNPGNARKEAKVIFTFDVKAAAAEQNNWKNGGIPSTEVGLKNFLEDQDVKDFALFVNYKATTGSLFATATLDPDSGSVIFDVSNILAALNGTTIGSVQDIYYALATGIAYGPNDAEGLWVKEVTYEYNDAASDAAATTDGEKKEEEKPADNKPADNGDKEITIGGDDKETEIPADNNGGATNNGSAVVDNGANKADENPHTGVALAVIPAIVAGAAVVVSKKRK